MVQDLKLTPSTLEQVETVIDQEVQLRLEVALLEADAIAKKHAADVALQNAMDALKEVTSNDEGDENADVDENESPIQGGLKETAASVAASMSLNGTIEEIARLMKEAEEEAEASPSPEDAAAEGREEEPQPALSGGPNVVTSSDLVVDSEAYDELGSPKSYGDTMEDTLDTIMFKIEECSAIISDPGATMQEQLDAAQLVSQYAKAAKAFQNAI